jgi:hypothetical protein
VFDVALDQAIDGRTVRRGSAFHATVLQPLLAPSGRLVVLAGAKVEGKVVDTGHPQVPHLTLAFSTIATAGGVRLLDASIRSADSERYFIAQEAPGAVGGRSYFTPLPDSTPLIASQAKEPVAGLQILLRPGARIRVELNQPVD